MMLEIARQVLFTPVENINRVLQAKSATKKQQNNLLAVTSHKKSHVLY